MDIVCESFCLGTVLAKYDFLAFCFDHERRVHVLGRGITSERRAISSAKSKSDKTSLRCLLDLRGVIVKPRSFSSSLMAFLMA